MSSSNNNYYRNPHPTHECGLMREGRACTLGPKGDTCGTLRDNHPQCVPTRTMQGWFRMLGIILTLITTIGVCLLLPSWKVNSVLAPGPLSQAHAQLLQSSGPHGDGTILSNDRCAACHPVALSEEEKHLLILNHTKDGRPAGVGLQSQLCLNCHQENMPNAREGSPHDLVGDELKALFASLDVDGKSSEPKSISKQTTECSQCHREHRSSHEDLTTISSERCQACHRQQFASFSVGHPEFTNFPLPRERQIGFDHLAHRDLHFAKKNQEFDCRLCHVSSGSTAQNKDVFRSVSFEKACAACHVEALNTEATDGVVVLQLPSLDRRRLHEKGVDIGPWPESASQIMEGDLSLLWQALILAEEGGSQTLAKLPRTGKLSDIDWNDPEQLKNLSRLTETMRKAFAKLARQGQPRIKEVVEKAAAHNPSGWSVMFASGFPVDLVRLANQRWFEQMNDELLSNSSASDAGSEELLTADTALADDNLLSSENSLGDEDSLVGENLLGGESLLDGQGTSQPGAFSPDRKELDTVTPLRGWEHMPFGGWLLDDSRVAMVYVPKPHGDGWLSRWIEWQTQNHSQGNTDPKHLGINRQCLQCHQLNSTKFELVQRSMASTEETHRDRNDDVARFTQLWKISQSKTRKGIHKFNHSPHLTIASLNDCQSCHLLSERSPEPSFAVASPGFESSTEGSAEVGFLTEFKDMTKMLCASCHQSHLAGDACTQCHNYHVHEYAIPNADRTISNRLEALKAIENQLGPDR